MPAANRRAIREAAVQTFFECDFREETGKEWAFFEKNFEEHECDNFEEPFARALVDATFEKLPENQELVERLAPDWPWSKIARIDRAILAVGLAELRFLDAEKFNLPPKAVLNEYVEISKNYSDDSTRRFVNGVMSSAKKLQENE